VTALVRVLKRNRMDRIYTEINKKRLIKGIGSLDYEDREVPQ
jgi:hypothetical protein